MLIIILAYVSILLFIGLSVYKAYQYSQMPLHGRLELYPVPKEKGHKHGGSYFEELEWWKKPRETSHGSELVEMLKEMLFIKKLFENQKPLWWISYALHLGIYFLAAWTVLLVLSAILVISGAEGSGFASLIFGLSSIVGLIGIALATFGSGFLLLRRLFDPILSKYTTPQEYFNLILIWSVLVTGIFAWMPDLGFAKVRDLVVGILTFTPVEVSGLVTLHFILLAIMFIYIPLSKMSHYVGKYFSFHKVLWENDPNLAGNEIDAKVRKATSYKPQTKWSAPHINPPAASTENK